MARWAGYEMRISKEDSSDLDFVVQCLMTGAIDVPELRAWCEHLVATSAEVPDWVFDLISFDEAAFHVYRVIGFVPHGSDANRHAVAGIALKRGRSIDATVFNPAKAQNALSLHPEVMGRFGETFPFLGDV